MFVEVDGGWMWKDGYNDELVTLECGVKGITEAEDRAELLKFERMLRTFAATEK